MSFNLKDYETVKERKKRFYAKHENGRIIVELLNQDTVLQHALIKCSIYKNSEDQEKNIAWSTGYAHEERDTEIKKSKKGNDYTAVNFTSWVENCEESAIGRALDNAGYAGGNKCSREEMEKVERKNAQKKATPPAPKKELSVELYSKLIGEAEIKDNIQDLNIHFTKIKNEYITTESQAKELMAEFDKNKKRIMEG